MAVRSLVVMLLTLPALACSGDDSPSSPSIPPPPAPPFTQTELVVGTGATAVNGRFATIHYTLWLYDPAAPEQKGMQMETSLNTIPHRFLVGAGSVIRGWDLGVPSMRVGGQRRLVIPYTLAYGASGSGSIGPYQSLVFDLELIRVE
jgi:FKBP-type peptidyl-prolyl cis-trans isomerase FkpA